MLLVVISMCLEGGGGFRPQLTLQETEPCLTAPDPTYPIERMDRPRFGQKRATLDERTRFHLWLLFSTTARRPDDTTGPCRSRPQVRPPGVRHVRDGTRPAGHRQELEPDPGPPRPRALFGRGERGRRRQRCPGAIPPEEPGRRLDLLRRARRLRRPEAALGVPRAGVQRELAGERGKTSDRNQAVSFFFTCSGGPVRGNTYRRYKYWRFLGRPKLYCCNDGVPDEIFRIPTAV